MKHPLSLLAAATAIVAPLVAAPATAQEYVIWELSPLIYSGGARPLEINEAGVVAGASYDPSFSPQPVVWSGRSERSDAA